MVCGWLVKEEKDISQQESGYSSEQRPQKLVAPSEDASGRYRKLQLFSQSGSLRLIDGPITV
jgi:phage/plasmid primase-like uncharacterized protein